MKVLLTKNSNTTVSNLDEEVEVSVQDHKNIEVWEIKTKKDLAKLYKRHSEDLDKFLEGGSKKPSPLLVVLYYDDLYSEEVEDELLSLLSFAAVSNMYIHLRVKDKSKRTPLVAQCDGSLVQI